MLTLPELVAARLLSRNETVATAESCTGGLIGAAFTVLSGSSSWYHGGVIAYDNSVKMNLLGVSEQILDQCGAVSEETADQMVRGILHAINTTWGISVTGIAGPSGGTLEKPVGLVYIGTGNDSAVVVSKNLFSGDRELVRQQTVETALKQLLDMIS